MEVRSSWIVTREETDLEQLTGTVYNFTTNVPKRGVLDTDVTPADLQNIIFI